MKKGWHGEKHRHSMASKGVKSNTELPMPPINEWKKHADKKRINYSIVKGLSGIHVNRVLLRYGYDNDNIKDFNMTLKRKLLVAHLNNKEITVADIKKVA